MTRCLISWQAHEALSRVRQVHESNLRCFPGFTVLRQLQEGSRSLRLRPLSHYPRRHTVGERLTDLTTYYTCLLERALLVDNKVPLQVPRTRISDTKCFTVPTLFKPLVSEKRLKEVYSIYYSRLTDHLGRWASWHPETKNGCIETITTHPLHIEIIYQRAEIFPTFIYDLAGIAQAVKGKMPVYITVKSLSVSRRTASILVYYGDQTNLKVSDWLRAQYDYDLTHKSKYRAAQKNVDWILEELHPYRT